MANGPGDYRDPKVTTTDRGGSLNWIWWLIGALLVLLLLAWLLGWFGSEVAQEAQTEGAATETVVADEPAAETVVTEEPAATEGAATEPVVTEDGDAVVTEDGDAVVTEE